jgi:hypothetical protein
MAGMEGSTMKTTTLMDLGRHAANKAEEAVSAVAQLVENLDERAVRQTYAAGGVCAALVVTIVAAHRERSGSLVVDEGFVRGVMAEVTNLVVGGVLLGEKMRAQGAQ